MLPFTWSSIQGHPSVRLSAESLELCTENLGNETGSDMVESDVIEFLSCGSWEGGRKEEKKKKARHQVRKFPPPLTTIRGTESVRVKPHREGGRLLLQLTKVNLPSCFQAQRTHGRLRLCFSNHINNNNNNIQEQDQGVESVDAQTQNNGQHEHEHEHGQGSNSWSVMRVENNKYHERPSRRTRCNEPDHEHKDFLINWGEPFCVAIS
uniref:FAF domain-containing protein n=1 Tax=Cajanus cajan TaxID=3821 RepID=A0A151TJY9_CAJCA|nr:hypothetical protein KK1_013700 [Cajanus cajan]